jgi:hypothetical protein
MRKSRRVAVAVAVSGLVAAGGLTFGLMANANTKGLCDSSASPGTLTAPITCSLPNSTTTDTTINTPSAIQVAVKLLTSDNATTADQYIKVVYQLYCSQGGNQATTTNTTPPAIPAEQAITKGATVTDTLVLGEPAPDSCTVVNVTATLEVSTDGGKTFSTATTGSFNMTLQWTPASTPTPTATSSSPPPPPTHHVSTIKGYGNKCLDAKGNSSANGTKVIIWTCNSSDSAQGWSYSSGALKHNGHCANIQGNGGSGSKLILWTCNGASNERWFHTGSNGEFVSAGTAHGLLCVDDPGYSKTNGTQLTVYRCHNTGNQHWS